MSDSQDFDLSFLYEIADGSNEFIVESIDMFLLQSPELLQAIESAIAARDWNAVAQAAHKLKSNLGFFGMLTSQALIQDIEMASKSGGADAAQIESKFAQVKSLVGNSNIALKKIKTEKGG